MTVIKKGESDAQIIKISECGYGNRNKATDFRLTSRGAKGVRAGTFNEKTGKLVCLKQVHIDDDLMIIADNGVIIRTPVKDISLLSRGTQGVKIMKLKNDAKVVCLTTSEHEEQEDNSTIDEVIEQNIKNNDENSEKNSENE